MLIVAGIPNHPAKFKLHGIQSNQQMIIEIPMNPIVQTECSVIVLRAMDSVTLPDAQMRHKFSTCATLTMTSKGLTPMSLPTLTTLRIVG
jgi:hypothetical protein